MGETQIADTPSALGTLVGWDTDTVVTSAYEMNSILQVYMEESESMEKYVELGNDEKVVEKYRNLILLSRTWYQCCQEFAESATGWITDIKLVFGESGFSMFEGDERVKLIKQIRENISILDELAGLSDEQILDIMYLE